MHIALRDSCGTDYIEAYSEAHGCMVYLHKEQNVNLVGVCEDKTLGDYYITVDGNTDSQPLAVSAKDVKFLAFSPEGEWMDTYDTMDEYYRVMGNDYLN